MSRLCLLLCLGLSIACGPQEDSGFGSGGGSGYDDDDDEGGDDGDDGGQQQAPVIENVTAAFDTLAGGWAISFAIDYEYNKDMSGGVVEFDVTEEGADPQSFDLGIDSGDQLSAYIDDDGNIAFAVDDVSPTKRYLYAILLESPQGTRSERHDGVLEPRE